MQAVQNHEAMAASRDHFLVKKKAHMYKSLASSRIFISTFHCYTTHESSYGSIVGLLSSDFDW